MAQISGGTDHSLALKTDGTLWAAGTNAVGQLGDGTTNSTSLIWKQVLTDVSQIEAGNNHSLALKTDGTLWGAGGNANGQLGDGTTSNSTSWKQVLTDVSQISAGTAFSLALKTDGTVWATGLTTNGQYGKTVNSTSWSQVLTDAKQISAGDQHSLAIKTDGTIWACGYNAYGQLGDGTTTKSTVWKQTFPSEIIAATEAVVKAESSKLQADVDSAKILVNALPTGTAKTALLDRLTAVQSQIDYIKAVAEANGKVITAESTKLQADVMLPEH